LYKGQTTMKKTIFALLLTSLILVPSAFASTVTINSIVYENRNINTGLNKNDYRGSWYSQTSSVTSSVLADFNGVASPWLGDTLSRLVVNFDSDFGDFSFNLAPDAGLGGALYLDGNLIASSTDDLWWSYDWNNASEILSALVPNLSSGSHVLEGFWGEACCHGGQGLLINPVLSTPIPAAVWLFGSALAGLIGLGKRKKMSA
jgi:hypothetical protein